MSYSAEQLCSLGVELVREAEKRKAQLRLLGGIAVFVSSPQAALKPALRREYKDLDFAVNRKGVRGLGEVFVAHGWEEDRRFNALHGQDRLLFYYHAELQADIFIGRFEQCHVLNLENRLGLNDLTLPLADLLLTKLQIHRLNSKDVLDIITLLLDHLVEFHEAGDGRAPDEIDLNFICHLTGEDWAWYTSVHDNLAVLEQLLPDGHLSGEDFLLVRTRLEKLRGAIESQPKTFRWQARNVIGRRLPWYNEPEEVNR
jgi:hypothetical protein